MKTILPLLALLTSCTNHPTHITYLPDINPPMPTHYEMILPMKLKASYPRPSQFLPEGMPIGRWTIGNPNPGYFISWTEEGMKYYACVTNFPTTNWSTSGWTEGTWQKGIGEYTNWGFKNWSPPGTKANLIWPEEAK